MNDLNCQREVHGSTPANAAERRLIIATSLRPEGNTGVHTHVRQLREYLRGYGTSSALVTPFSWGRPLTYPVFGLRRLVLDRLSQPAGLAWYRHWHEVFLRNALRECLDGAGACVIYAQDPLAARAALRARRGPHQQVVLAVHFRISEANESTAGGGIKQGGLVFRAIRKVEREVIPATDRLVFVSQWARDTLLSWLPEAASVPSAVIGNFVAPLATKSFEGPRRDLVTTGRLEHAKNHRFLLEVLAEARDAGRFFSLDVFGDGPSRDDLLRQVHDLGLEEQVRFLGFRPDVRELLPGYRAYVHASYSESLPLAIIEAMAAGLPIIAADTGGISEIYDDGVEGLYWSLASPTEAAATLVSLLDSEPALAQAATAASQRFQRDFDAGVVAPRLRSFLLEDEDGPRSA